MNKEMQVLDVCCGPRSFWFNKYDERALFNDIRRSDHVVKDKSSKGGTREICINPDTLHGFENLPFSDSSFYHVIFDPPHLEKAGESSWLVKRYGKLRDGWQEQIKKGFAECFRVLKPNGTLIFKWSEYDILVSELLALTDQKPLYGHKSGKRSKTHWIAFIKEGEDD